MRLKGSIWICTFKLHITALKSEQLNNQNGNWTEMYESTLSFSSWWISNLLGQGWTNCIESTEERF